MQSAMFCSVGSDLMELPAYLALCLKKYKSVTR